MIIDRISSTALADVCANLFAALMLMLIVVITMGRPTGGADPSQIEVTALDADRRLSHHKPLTPGDMVQILRARSLRAAGTSIDLHAGVALVLSDGRAHRLDLQHTATPMLPAIIDPVRLYVFDQSRYALLRQRLADAGHPIATELPVPQALRTADGSDWSRGFADLSMRDLDASTYRDALARLLDGQASGLPTWDRLGGSTGPSPGTTRTLPSFATIGQALSMVVRVLLWACLIGLVAFIVRTERSILRQRRVGAALTGSARPDEV